MDGKKYINIILVYFLIGLTIEFLESKGQVINLSFFLGSVIGKDVGIAILPLIAAKLSSNSSIRPYALMVFLVCLYLASYL